VNAPKARKEGLVIRHLPKETVIFDEKTGKAHCLNHTAAQVWKQCTGKTSPAQIAQKLAGELGSSEANAVVRLALEQLSSRNLLETPVRTLSGQARLNRREVLKGLAKGAVVAAALPLIMTMASKTGRAAGASTKTPCHATCQYGSNGTLISGGSDGTCPSGTCSANTKCPATGPANQLTSVNGFCM
jgi:hypothetical protein